MLKKTYEKHKHLIGAQINKWTILDIIERRDNTKGYIYAKAKCICGTSREIRLSVLLNNKSEDCGCGSRERLNKATINKYENLLGTTINKWTILDIIPPNEKQRKTFLMCMCQCGTTKEVQLSYVLNGKSKDCGCGRKNTLRDTLTKNLVGQRFGKLTVVEMLEERNKAKRIMYRCKCDCGGEVTTSAICLKNHHTSSCGCILSYWNSFIDQLLTGYNIDHIPEYRVTINDRTYRFDFYLPQYNLFIEYDGEHHYQPINYHSMSNEEAELNLEKRKRYDKIKDNYCVEQHINLLRIPYWEKENIETIINNHLQRLSEKGFVA